MERHSWTSPLPRWEKARVRGAYRHCTCLVALAVLVGGLYAARGQILPCAAHWLDVGQPPQAAEYVMVLGGEYNTRPFVGAALWKAGLARQVLMARVIEDPDIEDGIAPPHHEVECRVLRLRGVPDDCIVLLGERADSTFDEATLLSDFLASRPESRVTVVTSDYHTRRSHWIFTRVLGDRAQQVAFVSAPTEDFYADTWWETDKGFRAVMGEYVKLVLYGLRYGWLGYEMAGVLVAAVLLVIWRRSRRRRVAKESVVAIA